MRLSEYASYDGLGLAALVRKKEISPRELAELLIQGCNKVNPKINAVIEVFEDKLVDLEDTTPEEKSFSGVPFLMKDLGSGEKGRKQEQGSRFMQGYVIEEESFLMTRFKEAGLVNLGRTTTPEFALSSSTESVFTGETRNPWNLDLMAGGSSGGAAAAVAAGILPVAHASDGAGSIRIPASSCGLVGLKISRGRISPGPDASEHLYGLGVEFIVSRSVRDSAAMLDAVHGPGVGDPYMIIPPERPYLEEIGAPTGKLRIAYASKPWSPFPVDPEISGILENMVSKLENMGHDLIDDSPEYDYETYLHATLPFWCASMPSRLELHAKETGRVINLDYIEPVSLAFYEYGKQLHISDLVDAYDSFNQIRRGVGRFFQDYDLLLTPTLCLPPQPIGKYSQNNPGLDAIDFFKLCDDSGQYLPLFNLTGQPAISLPLYQSETGLPIGIQFVSHFGDEAALFRIASALEQEMPWSDRVPPVHVSR